MFIEGQIIADHSLDGATATTPALIGPHAVIHTAEVMREALGKEACDEILSTAQVSSLPTGEHMIPEIDALRIHRWLALREPVDCFTIAQESAKRTADYIIANRIPALARWLLSVLPAGISAHLLMKAIGQHAWTFIGAGRFEPRGAWAFAIDRSEANDLVMPPESLFHWYAEVFQRLYRRLIGKEFECQMCGDELGHSKRRTYRIRALSD